MYCAMSIGATSTDAIGRGTATTTRIGTSYGFAIGSTNALGCATRPNDFHRDSRHYFRRRDRRARTRPARPLRAPEPSPKSSSTC